MGLRRCSYEWGGEAWYEKKAEGEAYIHIFFPLPPAHPFLFKLCSLDSERSNAAEELHECKGGRGLCSISGCL